MKILKRTIVFGLVAILLILAGLFISRPYLLRVLWYRTPNATTYQAFPQSIVHPGDSVFRFIKPQHFRNDLDTLSVRDGKGNFISFAEYFQKGKLKAFIVIRNDSLLYQKYSASYSDSTLTTIFSGAKSIISLMIGQALAQGEIKNLDDKVIQYIPELKANPSLKSISIKNLIDMKSGLAFEDALGGGVIKAFLSDEAKYYYTHDMKAELMKVKLVNQPGTVWKYKSIDPILLAWVLERASGKTVAAYFEEHTWKKIGAAHQASFGLDQPGGLANTASRFQVSAIDFAKIGRLYLHLGRYNNHQVLPGSWVKQSVNLGSDKPASAKGWQQSAHHYLWWIPQVGDNGDYGAEGMLGQRLYVDTKTNTIIVQFADGGAGDYPYRKISRYLSGLPFEYPKS